MNILLRLKKYRLLWNRLKSKTLKFFFVFLSIVFFIYVLVWNIIAFIINDKIDQYIENPEKTSRLISFSDRFIEGFPSDFRLRLRDPKISNLNNTMGWSSDFVTLTPLVFKNKTVRIDTAPEHKLKFRLMGSSKVYNIQAKTENLKISTSFQEGYPNPINIFWEDVALFLPDLETSFGVGKSIIKLYDNRLRIRNQLSDAVSVELNINNIRLNRLWRNILEGDIQQATGIFHIRHPNKIQQIPQWDHFLHRGFDPPEIIIEDLKIFHPLTSITVDGYLLFDKQKKISGYVNIHIDDYNIILETLEKKGVITSRFSQFLRGIFSFSVVKDNVHEFNNPVRLHITIDKNHITYNDISIFSLRRFF